MLKYIIALILLVALWAAVLLFELPIWVGLVGSLVVVLVVGALVFGKWWRARRSAKNLEDALAAQAADQMRNARPDRAAELAEIQGEFEKAVGALKSSALGGGGASALYALPWYVIIGPPGAGKTTALQKSGLTFPHLSRDGGGVRGVGGTRNCDWWLTNEGVLLDTAGRWTTEDEDRNEWFGFLDLLRRYRPRKPLNGLIVAVSVDLLAGATEQDVQDTARRVRARLDEAMSRLQMSLPVYVMFTKCDLVPGFVESFDQMSRNERRQTWGFTTKIDPTADPSSLFDHHFSELGNALEKNMIRRLGEERRIERREAVFAFPKQFSTLGPSLSQFVGTLFESNVFDETPLLRGCYFVSGTQEGRPIDRVMFRIADALGVTAAPPEASTTESKSYFLMDLFKNVIFPDAGLAIESVAGQKQRRRRTFAVAAGIFLLSFGVLALPAIAWGENLDLVEQVSSAIDAIDNGAATEEVVEPAAFAELRAAVSRLDEEAESTPFSMTYGMYQGETLRGPARGYLATALRDRVVQPLRASGVADLESLTQRFARRPDQAPSASAHREAYNRLKIELLLTSPTADDQPALNGEYREFLVGRLARGWMESEEDDSEAEELMGLFTDELLVNDRLMFRRDSGLVAEVRNVLNRAAGEQIVVDSLIERFDRLQPISVRNTLGSTVGQIRGRRTVRPAFTKEVWTARIQPLLEQPIESLLGEPWVLGALEQESSSEAERARQLQLVRSEYFSRYIDEWREFIRGLHTVPPRGGNSGALNYLQDITRGEPSPFTKLFAMIEENVSLADPEPEEANGEEESATGNTIERMVRSRMERTRIGQLGLAAVGDAQSSTGTVASGPTKDSVRERFEGFFGFAISSGDDTTGLSVYEEQLLFVRDALQTHLDDPSDPGPLAARLQQARTRTRGLIGEQEVGWRPAFNALLWPPVDGASMSFSEASALGAGRAWCNDVVSPFERMLSGRYPLNATGMDLSLSDFADFYRPDEGTLWSYYSDRLGDLVERQGDEFGFKQRLGRPASGVLQTSLLRFLQRSQAISRAFFPNNATEPEVEFDVHIRPSAELASVKFMLSGEEFEYHNGPEEWRRFVWPGEDPLAGASIQIRGESMDEEIEQEGEWGLFHLIERGSISTHSGERVFAVEWRLATHGISVVIDFRPSRSDNPFLAAQTRRSAMFGGLRTSDAQVPREVVTSRRVCPRN